MIVQLVCIILYEHCYIIWDDEVDDAICAGVITSKKQKHSRECRAFTQISRCNAKIKALKKSIRAIKLETYLNVVKGVNNEKKDNL